MISVYIQQKKDNERHIPLLNPNLGIRKKPNRLFSTESQYCGPKLFRIVSEPNEADYLLIPHNFFDIAKDAVYVDDCVQMSVRMNKKVLIFDFSDFDWDISVPNSVVFRYSQYGYKKKDNEYIVPPFAEDLGDHHGVVFREKGPTPLVGFVGWAGHLTLKSRVVYVLKNLFAGIASLWSFHSHLHRQGIYFRRKALRLLGHTKEVMLHATVRNSYSAHTDTIALSPEQARKEYIENIQTSDLCLAPKGDGNFSLRFYEILSLGRIPLLIDTDMCLPMSDSIPYDDFILRVSSRDIQKLPQIVKDFWGRTSKESYIQMQKKARYHFSEFLAPEVFYQKLFEKVL